MMSLEEAIFARRTTLANSLFNSEVRGALVALQQLAITFGIMISFWID